MAKQQFKTAKTEVCPLGIFIVSIGNLSYFCRTTWHASIEFMFANMYTIYNVFNYELTWPMLATFERRSKMSEMEKAIKTNLDSEYMEWLADLKQRVRRSQIKAAVHVNSSMLELYWSIGADIVGRQAEAKWGSGVILQLSKDLRNEFPDVFGFSERNMRSMKRFFQYYSQDVPIRHQLGAKLEFPEILGLVPWRHHVEIMARSKSLNEALFYVRKTIENGWSRAMLLNFMSADLYSKQGKAPNNFSASLPGIQSDLASELLKDPYNFDFLMLTEGYREAELERALIGSITDFLLELGQGFAYVGKQVPLEVGDECFKLDLLFYHLKLRCYVAIELKAGKFSPKDLGQLGFYIATVNHKYKTDADNPTVGMLICKEKDNTIAKYALEGSAVPIGISEYELAEIIPDDYRSSLPTIEEIEEEMENFEAKFYGS